MNQKLRRLLDHYSESHQNPRNQIIHKFAVPLIMFSLLGLIAQIPLPLLNAAWLMVGLASIYYLQFKELKVFASVYLLVIPLLILIHFNPIQGTPFYAGVFILAWMAQFIGHRIEGRKPSFLEDLQYLLIGPIWIMKDVFYSGELR